jgi:hypothetical protein
MCGLPCACSLGVLTRNMIRGMNTKALMRIQVREIEMCMCTHMHTHCIQTQAICNFLLIYLLQCNTMRKIHLSRAIEKTDCWHKQISMHHEQDTSLKAMELAFSDYCLPGRYPCSELGGSDCSHQIPTQIIEKCRVQCQDLC